MKKALQVAMFSLFTVIGFNAQANEHHHETMSEAQPQDRKSTRLNSSHITRSRMPSSA